MKCILVALAIIVSNYVHAQYKTSCIDFTFAIMNVVDKSTVDPYFLAHPYFDIVMTNCSSDPLEIDTAIGQYMEEVGYFVVNLLNEYAEPICIENDNIATLPFYDSGKLLPTMKLPSKATFSIRGYQTKDRIKKLPPGAYKLTLMYVKKFPDGRGYYEQESHNQLRFTVK